MHTAQEKFFSNVLEKYPNFRSNVLILDVGSQDINGNNRKFFTPPYVYNGLDIGPDKNVDTICKVHLYRPAVKYDVVISGEMLEHDKHWRDSISAMYNLTKLNGLLTFTCATTGRQPHGTKERQPIDSPYTTDYYMNLTADDIRSVMDLDKSFKEYNLEINSTDHDLYFYGIKGAKIGRIFI